MKDEDEQHDLLLDALDPFYFEFSIIQEKHFLHYFNQLALGGKSWVADEHIRLFHELDPINSVFQAFSVLWVHELYKKLGPLHQT